MLAIALCLVLATQCVVSDNHNSVEEILERIGDYAESLGRFCFCSCIIHNIFIEGNIK